MDKLTQSFLWIILAIGGITVLAVLVRVALDRLGVPALVGYLFLGFGVRLLDHWTGVLAPQFHDVMELLAKIGLICLLFRVGLESDLRGLLKHLSGAMEVWTGDVLISGLTGFAAAHWLLGLDLIPSLFVAVALTATSVGMTVRVWQSAGQLKTGDGETLLDVAELDDISGIFLMVMLFAIVPVLREGGRAGELGWIMGRTVGWVLVKLILFGGLCLVFSRYVEPRVTSFFKRREPTPAPMIVIVGIAFLLAAVAGLMGFSVAIGAFFAGLVFSRDPQAVRMEASFDSLYELFMPFFFLGVGLQMAPGALTAALGLGGVLLAAAAVGKVAGGGLPTLLTRGRRAAMLIGASLIPRAEIAMFVSQQGLHAGDWALPEEVYSGMVLVSAATCLASPLLVQWLLVRWPPIEKEAPAGRSPPP